MKSIVAFFVFSFCLSAVSAQTAESGLAPNPDKVLQTVEVSCGKCKLGLAGKSCDMAVRIDDKAYYVDGANIDNYGDAHAHDGMCNIIRKAQVQGDLVDGRLKVTYIKLLPEPKKEEAIKH